MKKDHSRNWKIFRTKQQQICHMLRHTAWNGKDYTRETERVRYLLTQGGKAEH